MDQVCRLGFLLDLALLLDKQVVAVTGGGRAFLQLWLVRQLHPFLEKKDLAIVARLLVTSRLSYRNTFYVGSLRLNRMLQQACWWGASKYQHDSHLGGVRWAPYSFLGPNQRAGFALQILKWIWAIVPEGVSPPTSTFMGTAFCRRGHPSRATFS